MSILAAGGMEYCFGETNTSLYSQCLPGETYLPPSNTSFNDICCCSFATCAGNIDYSIDNKGSVAHLFFMGFGLLFFCVLFGLVCKGIRYDWLNIPFFVVELVYDPPEHVQWVDPWRNTTTKKTEEKGYFKTRAALEIYIKKKHKKTPADLSRYWHENPSNAGGVHLPSTMENIFKRIVLAVVAGILGIVLAPIVFAGFFYNELNQFLNNTVHIFCSDALTYRFVWGSFFLFVALVCMYYSYKVWKHNQYQVTTNSLVPFVTAMASSYVVFAVDYLGSQQAMLTQRIHYQSVCLFFFTWDLSLTIFRIYLQNEQGLDIDLPKMIKRYRGKHEAKEGGPQIWIVSGCPKDDSNMHEANGEYFRSPVVHIEDNVAWSRIVGRMKSKNNPMKKKKGNNDQRNKGKSNNAPKVGNSAEIRFGQGVQRRIMLGKIIRVSKSKKTVSVSFGVELGTSDDAPVYVKLDWKARPGRQPFSFKIMRVATKVLRNQPHWVLVDNRNGQCIGGLGGQVRYAARDLSDRALDEPPSSGWHSLSENPANQAAPSILSWDVAHYSINKKAEEKSQSTTSKNRRVIGLLYFFWLLILVGFVAANEYNGCLSSGEKQTLVLPVLVIIWVELANPLMSGVGIDLSPLKLSLFQIIVRLLIVAFPMNNFFVAGCVVYVLFACRVGWYWANDTYPVQTVREVLKEELRGALPEWMFSGNNGGGQNFVDSTALIDRDALFSPLLKLASTFDCLTSGLTGKRRATGNKSCAGACASFLQSASFVLFYFTLPFLVALLHVNTWAYECLPSNEDYELPIVPCDRHNPSFTCPDDTVCTPLYGEIGALNYTDRQGVVQTDVIEQWEIGLLSLGLVGCVITYGRFSKAYAYYGHTVNKCPTKFVLIEAIPFTVIWILTGVILFYNFSLFFLAFLFYVGPPLIIITTWTLHNWEAMDYTLLFKRQTIAKRGGAFSSPMKLLKGTIMASDDATGAVGTDTTDDDTTAASGTSKKGGGNSGILADAGAVTVAGAHAAADATLAGAQAGVNALKELKGLTNGKLYAELWKDGQERCPTVVGMLFGPVGCALFVGFLLENYTSNETFPHWVSWTIPAAFNLIFCTFLLVKVYFRTFSVQYVILICIFVWGGVLSRELGALNPQTCHLYQPNAIEPLDHLPVRSSLYCLELPRKYMPENAVNNSINQQVCGNCTNTNLLNPFCQSQKELLKTSSELLAEGCERCDSLGVDWKCPKPPPGVKDQHCLKTGAKSYVPYNKSICNTPYDTASCHKNGENLYMCECDTYDLLIFKYHIYFGNNCQYTADGYSAGLPTSLLAIIWSFYPAITCITIGLYKWYLLDFRFEETKTILKWVVAGDSIVTIWFFYMIFAGGADNYVNFLKMGNDGIDGETPGEVQLLKKAYEYEVRKCTIILVVVWLVAQCVLWFSFSYIANGFRLPRCCKLPRNPCLKVLSKCFLYLLSLVLAVVLVLQLVASLVGDTIHLIDYFNFVIHVLCLYLIGPVMRVMFGERSQIHFPETIFPIYVVSTDTDKMIRDDSSVKNMLYILLLLMFHACFIEIMDNEHDSILDHVKYVLCLLFAVTFVLERHFYTKDIFTKAWAIVRNQTMLLDRLRSQAIEHEMKDLGSSGSTSTNPLVNGQDTKLLLQFENSVDTIEPMMESSYKELVKLISSQPNHPWENAVETPMFDTHQNCIKAVGQVPAEMPPSWSCFTKTVDTLNVADDIARNINNTAMEGGLTASVKNLQSQATNLSSGIQLTRLKSGFGFGEDSDSDSDDDEEDMLDYPELLVSSAGHSAVEGIYTYIGKKENTNDGSEGFPVYQLVNGELGMGCYITIVAIDDGWENQSKEGTLYWVIMHGSTVVYRTVHHRAVGTDRSGETKSNGAAATAVDTNKDVVPPRPDEKSSWMTVVEDAEPSPSVVSTVLDDWVKVYRAGKGIVKFQKSMERLAKEEQRLVARFRLLIIKSAFSQKKVEGTVLWNFVAAAIPALEERVEAESIKSYFAAHEDSDSEEEQVLLDIQQEDEEEKTRQERKASETEHVLNPLEDVGSSDGTTPVNPKGKQRRKTRPMTIIDRYNTSRLVERTFEATIHDSHTVKCLMEKISKKWQYKMNKQSLVVVCKHGQQKLDPNKTMKLYKTWFEKKGSKILVIEKYNISEMSAYNLKAWLLKKKTSEKEPPRKRILLQLGKIYSNKIKNEQLKQAKDAALEKSGSEERKKLLSGNKPLINIDSKQDYVVKQQIFADLQKEADLQIEQSIKQATDDQSRSVAKDKKEKYMEATTMYMKAAETLDRNPPVESNKFILGTTLLNKSMLHMKKLDTRDVDIVQSSYDASFSKAVEQCMFAVKKQILLKNNKNNKNSNQPAQRPFQDAQWQATIAKSGSLRKLQKLLSAAGGEGKVKIQWSSPKNMNLLWLDLAYLKNNYIWNNRPLRSRDEETDLFHLQQELVDRGDYAKFREKLNKSPNRRATLKLFNNDLKCIWWLDPTYIKKIEQQFSFVGRSMDALWDEVRPRYMQWRSEHMALQTETLWYDSAHDLLHDDEDNGGGTLPGNNSNKGMQVLKQQLLALFVEMLVELHTNWGQTTSSVEEERNKRTFSLDPKGPTNNSFSSDTKDTRTNKRNNSRDHMALSENSESGEHLQVSPETKNGSDGSKTASDYGAGNDEVDLFIGGIDPDDIRQGATLQDCWLLSALSILAGEDSAIQNIFIRHSINGQMMVGDRIEPKDSDYHMIRFYHSDKDDWEHVLVDDMVPKSITQNDPKGHSVYGHSREPETWVMMIEKAYAKWLRSSGGYDGLNLGLVTEALVALTGGASNELNIRSPAVQAEARSGKLWRRLVELKKVGASLGCGSPSGEDSFWDGNGIVQGHAYAILDLRKVQIPDSSGSSFSQVEMLLIRNPWGRNPWDLQPPLWYTHSMKPNPDQPWPIRPLDWSPMSPRWDTKGGAFVKRLLNWNPALDGATGKFWMTLEDFLHRYAAIFICRLPSSFRITKRDHWSFSKINQRSGGVLTCPTGHQNPQWKIEVKRSVPLFITLTQETNKFENLKYIMVAMVPNGGKGIFKPLVQEDMEMDGFHFSGKPIRQLQVSMDLDLVQPGWYTIVVCAFDPGSTIDFCLCVYSTVENCLSELVRLYDE